VGPRQVGKTTALEQVLARWPGPHDYASADLPAPPSADWIIARWQAVRSMAGRGSRRNNALVNAMSDLTFAQVQRRPDLWGRLVENAVGAHLLSEAATGAFAVHYWREGVDEVDYVVSRGGRVLGLEVKSGRPRAARGLAGFRSRFPNAATLVVGSGGIPLEQFLSQPVVSWLAGD
jgi:hypothetical protein